MDYKIIIHPEIEFYSEVRIGELLLNLTEGMNLKSIMLLKDVILKRLPKMWSHSGKGENTKTKIRSVGGKKRLTTKGHKRSFCNDGNILYFDGDICYIIVSSVKIYRTLHIKSVNWNECNLYFNEFNLKIMKLKMDSKIFNRRFYI